MNKKNFKIKPKIWPKEYTFEEFKQLNPNIAENLLINYYHKYLQEYAEDRSRHLNHFNDTKDNLSKELNLLNEKLINNSQESGDGDMTVGPTAATRKFRSPLDPIKNSIFFDRADDYILCGLLGDPPANGTVKPYKELTIASWVHSDPVTGVWTIGAPEQFHIANAAQASGWRFYHYNKRVLMVINTTKDDGTKQVNTIQSAFNQLSAGKSLAHTSGPLSGSGWHYLVTTYDGRYIKLYADGKLMTGGSMSGGSYADGIGDTGHDINSTRVSGSEGAIFYDEVSGAGPLTGIPYKSRVDFSIGAATTVRSNAFPYENQSIYDLWSGSIAEVAVWDKALDADIIYDIYQNNVSASQGLNGRYDLSYAGYPGADGYDITDEGFSYKVIGQYADNLVGWWKMEENTGTTTEDFSKNIQQQKNGILYNSPTWSGSFAPGI